MLSDKSILDWDSQMMPVKYLRSLPLLDDLLSMFQINILIDKRLNQKFKPKRRKGGWTVQIFNLG